MENVGGKPDRREKSTETAALLHAYLDHGDITARDRLIELYLPLVESFAHRYERSEDYDDLFQAGSIGLINAIDRFDLKRGGELAAFAVPNIVGEIKRHLRDRTTSVRTPRPIQELRARAVRCEAELSAKLQRPATPAEVARELGVDKDEVGRALATRRSGGEQFETALPEGPGDGFDVSDERLALASAFEALDDRERQIVYLRFVRDKSRSQVAQELGISERHLSRQTHAALAKLREQLERGGQEIVQRERPARAAATAQRPSPPASLGGVRRHPTPRVARQRPARHHEHPPYRISIVRDHGNAEGHEWTAQAQELPGCEAHGDSPQEAIRGIDAAIEEWIEDALAKGRELPDPRPTASYSGRLMLRMPRSLHAALSDAAEHDGTSLNQFIASSLERALAAPATTTGEAPEDYADDRRGMPALLRVAIIINLLVLLVAGVVAVIILVVGSQQGW
jgi:RNA polymerase sigma-B factor